jgi:hypothetical protein
MHNQQQLLDRQEKDIRLKTTVLMWVISIPLFSTCIPIVSLSSVGILLPFFILIALTLGTTSVWFFHSNSMNATFLEIKQLQERLANLETIISHDELNNKFAVSEITSLQILPK